MCFVWPVKNFGLTKIISNDDIIGKELLVIIWNLGGHVC